MTKDQVQAIIEQFEQDVEDYENFARNSEKYAAMIEDILYPKWKVRKHLRKAEHWRAQGTKTQRALDAAKAYYRKNFGNN